MRRWKAGRAAWALVPFLLVSSLTTEAADVFDGPEAGAGEVVSEQWFAYTLDETPIGWEHVIVRKTAEHYWTTQLVTLRVTRAGAVVESTSRSTYVELHDGTPIRISLRETQGAETIEYDWEFTGNGVVQTVSQLGRAQTAIRRRPEGEWMMPEESCRYVKAQIQARQTEIRFRRVVAEFGLQPVEVVLNRLGETTFTVEDEAIAVTEWTYLMEGSPAVVTQYRSPEGRRVYERTVMGLGLLEARLTSRAHVLETLQESPPELLVEMAVVPNQRILTPEKTRRVVFRLEAVEGHIPELPEAGGQRVIARDENSAVTAFEPDDPLPALEEERADDTYLEPSPLVDFRDPAVRELIDATRPVRPISQVELADRLCAFVHGYIECKHLGVAWATASETARTQQGDCTEHAVLLTALLRGQGIPARVAEGLVYVEESNGYPLFAWHMWTQALLGGRWVDLDATSPHPGIHAAYVLTGVSRLAERPSPASTATTVRLLGNLAIEIIEVKYRR